MQLTKRARLCGALCAIAAVFALNIYLQWSTAATHRWELAGAACVLGAVGGYFFALMERRLRTVSLCAGALFVLTQLVGERITNQHTVAQNGWELLWLLACVLLLAPAFAGLFARLLQWMDKQRYLPAPQRRLSDRQVFWGTTVILLLAWLPYLAAFYPGLFTYDISYQHLQYLNHEFNTHHPLAHTLMVGGLLDLGTALFGYPVKGLLIYTVLQMLLMAFAMASAMRLMVRSSVPRWLCITVLVCQAVLPFHSLMAISSTKDTLFAGAVLYMTVLVAEYWLEGGKPRRSWYVRFVLAEIAVGLMRKNGFVCLLAAVVIAVLAIRHNKRAAARLLAFALCGLVLQSGANTLLQVATNAQSGKIHEMLSVPIQQLSRVYLFTEDEAKDEIEAFLPAASRYFTGISDPVKNSSKITRENLPEFLKLWLRVGLRHPIMYIDAFAEVSSEFYHLNGIVVRGRYLETDFHTDKANWMLENSLWPWLKELTTRLYSDNEYLNIPLYSILLSHGFWNWLLMFAAFAALYLRRWAIAGTSLISLCLFMSILLSPCVMLRYSYPLILTGPFLLSMLMTPNGRKIE